MKKLTVNKLLLYLLLSGSPLYVHAQDEQDTTEYLDSLAGTPAEDTIVPVIQYGAPVYKERKLAKDFKEKYKDEEFVYEKKPQAKTLWDRFWEAVREFLNWLFSSNRKEESTAGLVVKRILAVLIILFLIYMIVRAILNKEGMWIFGRSRKKIAAQDSTEEDIHQMDFRKLTAETKQAGNYRLAVRYYFLWLLKRMSDREIIDWHWDKTNSDYLYEIKNPDLKKDFEYLTYVYDYSWYGDFPLDEKAFAKAEKTFQKTLNTL
ncbi:DUF4129 domain-containing protein [Flavobacterium hauense]